MNHHRPENPGSNLAQPTIIATSTQLESLMGILATQPAIAIDTESNSLYAYQEQVCLIQISVPDMDFILDPLAGLNVSPLAEVLSDPRTTKVLHAAEYDIICLKRDFGFQIVNLFDTMWAARILGWPHAGLGDILEEIFGVKTNKKYQRYDWGKRPLDDDALTYACMDTHYLLHLQQLQADALIQTRHWEEAEEVFAEIAQSEPATNPFDPVGFWRIKGAFDLSPRSRAVLAELYIWREQEACRQNKPPFKVLGNHALIALAQAAPGSLNRLSDSSHLKVHHVRRYGHSILQAIKRGLHSPAPEPPDPAPRRPREEIARYEALRAWRNKVAAERSVDPDVVMSNAALRALAERNPRSLRDVTEVNEIGPWKRKTYGQIVLDILSKQHHG
ncbi:MAG: ribonuclease D [Chloroflexi bacterium]|nr:ribonuclease D [Chloroflexota bacterium]